MYRACIITPVFNGEAFLRETIESVLADKPNDVQYLVIDDGSTDSTPTIIRSYGDRLTARRHDNRGEAATVNAGVAAAEADVIAVVNADDPIRPGLVKAALTMFDRRSDVVAVYPDWAWINQAGEVVREVRTVDFSIKALVRDFHCIPGPGTFFRRSALHGAAARNPRYALTSDYEMWLRLALHGPFARIPEVLATWRHHTNGLSVRGLTPTLASERIALMREFFARDDLPPPFAALRRKAMASAYYFAGLVAIHHPGVPGRRYLVRSYLLNPWQDADTVPTCRRSLARTAFILARPFSRPGLQLLQRLGLCRDFNRPAF